VLPQARYGETMILIRGLEGATNGSFVVPVGGLYLKVTYYEMRGHKFEILSVSKMSKLKGG
jgi:hypothetical protein